MPHHSTLTLLCWLLFISWFTNTVGLSVDVGQWAKQQLAAGKTGPDWVVDENFGQGTVSFGIQGKIITLDLVNGKVTWSGFTPNADTRLFWDAVVVEYRSLNAEWFAAHAPFQKFFPALRATDGNPTESAILIFDKKKEKRAIISVATGMVHWKEYQTPTEAAQVFWECVFGEYPALIPSA